MKKKYTYTISEFRIHNNSSRLWGIFTFSLLYFLLGPALSFHSIAQAGSSSGLANDEAIIWLATPGTGPILDCNTKEVTITSNVHKDGTNLNEGATFQWTGPDGFSANTKDIKVTKPGIYKIVAKTANGLTGNNAIEILGENYPKNFAGPDLKMYPANKTVQLQGYSHGYYDISWEASNGGNIVSGGNTLNPIVDAPGTYTITLRERLSGCTMQDVMVVTEAEDYLNVSIGVGSLFQLDCYGTPINVPPYVTLSGNEVKEGLTYSWSGPNEYTSEERAATISEPGDYTIVVTHTATGLTATSTLSISQRPRPEGSAGPDKVLTRDNPTVTLEGSVVNNSGQPTWLASDGGNFVSGYRTLNPIVDAPGTYTLVLQDGRGCKTEYTVKVTREEENTLLARISTSGVPQLGCDPADSYYMMGVAMLNGQTVEEGITFQWNGPNGYTSNDKNVSVTEAGDYTLVITYTALNLTATSEPVRVSRYTLPEGSAGPDKVLTCKNRTVTLEGSGHGMVQWTASHGGNIVSGHNTLNPVVDAPGIYTMQLNLMRGSCVSYFVVKVIREEDLTVSATGGKLNSGNGTVQLKGSSTTPNLTYSWTGPFGFTSTEQNPVVSEAGDYTLTVTSDLGCTASTTVTVEPPMALTNTQNSSQVRLYPNPVKDRARLEFKLRAKENYVVNLYDMSGILIREVGAGNTKTGGPLSMDFDVSNLSEGLYLVRIISTSETKTIQVIVKK